MQKIYFVVVGKIKESFYTEAVGEYVKRLSRFAKVEIKELAEGIVTGSIRLEFVFASEHRITPW